MEKVAQDILNVKITTPTEVIWEGSAKAVSSENTQGKFDILPLHANFVTLIQNKPILVRTDSRDTQYTFKTAVIHNSESVVRIFGDV